MLIKSVALLLLVSVLCVITFFKDSIRLKKLVVCVVSILYVFVLVSFTLVYREEVSAISLVPFSTFFEILCVRWYGWGEYIFLAIVGNMLLFMPLGMVLSNIVTFEHKKLLCFISGFIISLSIESVQLIYSIGTFEIDDLIINTWGAVVGCAVVDTIIKRSKNIKDNLHSLSALVVFCVILFVFCIVPVFKEILQIF